MNFIEKLAGMSVVNVIIVSAVLIIIRLLLKGAEGNPFLKQVAEFCESLAFAFLLVFLIIRPFFIQSFFIPSESMKPTLLIQDHLIANKFVYFFKDPKFKDVVIFKAPKEATRSQGIKPYDEPSSKLQRFWDVVSNGDTRLDFIKRVIGEPGDEIRVTPGYIAVKKSPEYPSGIIFHTAISKRLEVFVQPGNYGFVKIKPDGVYLDNKKISEDVLKEALFIPKEEKITLHPGEVFRNGKKLDEPFIAEDPRDPYPSIENPKNPWANPNMYMYNIESKPDWIIEKDGVYWAKVPKGKYLVMGDNRNDSFDARYWGFLDRKSIKGKAMFVFFPFNRIKIIK